VSLCRHGEQLSLKPRHALSRHGQLPRLGQDQPRHLNLQRHHSHTNSEPISNTHTGGKSASHAHSYTAADPNTQA